MRSVAVLLTILYFSFSLRIRPKMIAVTDYMICTMNLADRSLKTWWQELLCAKARRSLDYVSEISK